MFSRFWVGALLLSGLALAIAGCGGKSISLPVGGEDIVAVHIVPGSQAVATSKQTGQFVAIGNAGAGSAQNLTSQVTWSSSDASVATVSATGLATGLKPGKATISASVKNPDGSVVTADSTFIVTGITSEPLLSLAILPASQSVNLINESAQFIAVGTFLSAGSTASPSICKSTGYVQNCTKYVTWSSSEAEVGTINSTGLATGLSAGTTAITAIGTNPDGTLVTAEGTFTETGTGGQPQYSQVGVQILGSNADAGSVTGYLYNNTTHTTTGPEIINCAFNGQYFLGCTADLPVGSYIQFTANTTGTNFNGWTSNCDTTPDTPNTTSKCTIQSTVLAPSITVGALFN
jgi:Bacterial Ig-like domain (group 2)